MGWLLTTALLASVTATSGCYYGHLASGQMRLLMARRPIDEVLADEDTSNDLRERLERVVQARTFAEELGLEVGEKYTSYAPWPGDRIVTNVVATRPGEIEAAPRCFPIVGCVPYQGFFDEARAESLAGELREEGMDTCLVAVSAYSTLGWMNDPVTDPMLQRGEVDLVETLLHELVHATVFLKDEAELNEGVASFVGQEATVRFFERHDPAEDFAPRDRILDNRDLAAALVAMKLAVAELYAETDLAEAERSRRRAEIEAETREAIASLPGRTRTPEELRAFSERVRLNDACLALRGTYSGDSDRYAEVLASLDGDLQAFIQRLKDVAEAPDPRAAFFSAPNPAPR